MSWTTGVTRTIRHQLIFLIEKVEGIGPWPFTLQQQQQRGITSMVSQALGGPTAQGLQEGQPHFKF